MGRHGAVRRGRGPKKLVALIGSALVVAAVVKEIRTPPDERTWNGRVAGFVPYDFRVPTAERVRDRLWNPDGALVGPRVFGVGWAVNLGRAVTLARQATGDKRRRTGSLASEASERPPADSVA